MDVLLTVPFSIDSDLLAGSLLSPSLKQTNQEGSPENTGRVRGDGDGQKLLTSGEA